MVERGSVGSSQSRVRYSEVESGRVRVECGRMR